MFSIYEHWFLKISKGWGRGCPRLSGNIVILNHIRNWCSRIARGGWWFGGPQSTCSFSVLTASGEWPIQWARKRNPAKPYGGPYTEAEMLLYPSEAPPMKPIRAWNDIVKKNREHYDCDPNKLFVDYVNTRFGPYKIW